MQISLYALCSPARDFSPRTLPVSFSPHSVSFLVCFIFLAGAYHFLTKYPAAGKARAHAHDINPDLYYYANPAAAYLPLIQILK